MKGVSTTTDRILTMPGTKVYLAGPMRGLPEFNFPAFSLAARWLRARDYNVWSPAEHDLEEGFDPTKDEALPLKAYMKVDLPQVCEADWVCVLPGWEESEGATLEVEVAKRCGIPVREYADINPLSEGGVVDVDRKLHPEDYRNGDEITLAQLWTTVAPSYSFFDSDEDFLASLESDESILQEADRLVSTDRQDDYGHPLDDFGKVSSMALALWGRGPETPEEHALYMVLVKVARESTRHKRDNLVDIAGYTKTLDLVLEERERRAKAEPGAAREHDDGPGAAEGAAVEGGGAGAGWLFRGGVSGYSRQRS